MIVQITDTEKPTYWYADLVGEIFEVVEYGKDYVIDEDYQHGYDAVWRHISKDDCKILNTEKV